MNTIVVKLNKAMRNCLLAIRHLFATKSSGCIDIRTRVINIYERNMESRKNLADISKALADMRKVDAEIQRVFTRTNTNPALVFKNIIYN